jgi:hypothetical protein
MAAHRSLRGGRFSSGAAAARTGGVSAASGPGLGRVLRRDVRGSDRHDLVVRESAAAAWFQVVLFGYAALWLIRGSLAGSSQARRPWLPALLHPLMAGAMIWMLTAIPAVTGMPPAGPARAAVAYGSRPRPLFQRCDRASGTVACTRAHSRARSSSALDTGCLSASGAPGLPARPRAPGRGNA